MQQLIGWFTDDLRLAGAASQNTVAAYSRDLRRYHQWLSENGCRSWEEVDGDKVEQHIRFLSEGSDEVAPLASSSISRAISSIRMFHKWLVREGRVSFDPTTQVKGPKQAASLPKALSQEQVKQLLDAGVQDDSPRGLRDHALLELLYATGARISEVVALQIEDIDLEAEIPLVRLIGKGNKERLVPVGSYAKESVMKYLQQSRPMMVTTPAQNLFLFVNLRGKPLSRQSAWEIITTRSRLSGLDAEVSPHTLRHSFATHLLEGGASVREVQELLGHASVTTTQIYTRLSPESLRETYYSTHPRARY